MEKLGKLAGILAESGDPGNPGPEQVRDIMERVRTIAVVGISRNPDKAARRVPFYLASQGYEIVPVNPQIDRILGKAAVPSLEGVREEVDMVLVFRPSEEAARVAEVAMERPERPVIWLQEGIRAEEVAEEARSRGIVMVQNLCTYRVHQALSSG